jgi:TatA/E family protein of Tat protein translocase
MFGGIGIQEILIILVVGLLVFGAARLPKIARSLGQGIKEFKKTIKDTTGGDDDESESRARYFNAPPQGQFQPGPGQYYPPYQGQNPQYQGGYPPYQGQGGQPYQGQYGQPYQGQYGQGSGGPGRGPYTPGAGPNQWGQQYTQQGGGPQGPVGPGPQGPVEPGPQGGEPPQGDKKA